MSGRTFAPPPINYEPLFSPSPLPPRIESLTAFTDRPYQVHGVGSVVTGLRSGGRGQLRSACGTGKTKMAYWAAERLVHHGGITVVIAPTVGLVAQILAEWAHNIADYRALAVCSDCSVRDDNYGTTDDILERVTTDSNVIDAWLRLENNSAVQLIVGTHASAHVIGEGLQKAGRVADLLVIDEAHRTSGWIGKKTALLHDDEVLPAARRLYMTATPRVWDSSKVSGSATYSMDDERVFGRVLCNYPFSRAIDDGYLDDYRLLVIGVTKAEVLALLRQAKTRASAQSRLPDEHTAMVQAAIARGAVDFGLRRIIAFCPLIEDARRFAETFQQTLDLMPPQQRPPLPLHAAHVQGSMKQTQRRDILATLATPPNGGWTVVSNARCLSEGIDVPAVDGVAFTAPKSSPVEIVQAVGRALRRHEGGSGIATIIVPILLADTDSGDDDSIDAGSYDVLWQVLRGLRAHDETFGAALDRCRATHFHDSGALQRLQFLLPETHRAPEFVEHLTVRLVKSTTSKWWDGYAHLLDFHTREGHARVNHDHITDDGFRLGSWVIAARVAFKQNRLAPDRIEALAKLDFIFDASAADWEAGFAVAEAFHGEHGHLRPAAGYRRNAVSLLPWLGQQRNAHAKGTLAAERKARLDSIGMDWTVSEKWRDKLAELRAHHATHGALPNPKPYEHLSAAMAKVRAARTRGQLDAQVIAELDAMGMSWEPAAADWWDGYRHLLEVHAREGHARVPQTFVTDAGYSLGAWVNNTRTRCREGTLEQDRLDALHTIGFVIDPRVEAWETAFAAAAAFHSEHGHLRVTGGSNGDTRLAEFLRKQREAHARGALTAERKARLDAIGMAWELPDLWQDRVPEVRAYHAKHGRLPDRAAYHPLAGALRTLRAAHKRGQLDAEAIAELDAMGMDWDPPATDFWDGFPELVAFHAREGHVRVPSGFVTDTEFELGSWFSHARIRDRRGNLTDAQSAALRELGGLAEAKSIRSWEDTYAVAAQYADQHGDLTPDPSWRGPDDVDLYGWLVRQRRAHAKGTLDAKRTARLDEIGMEWTAPSPARKGPARRSRVDWSQLVSELAAFHAEHGHLPSENTDQPLSQLLSRMRTAYRRGQLDQPTIDTLTGLGVTWEPIPDWWDAYGRLAQFHDTFGHTRVTGTFVTDDGFALGAWAATVRNNWRSGRLSSDRVEALEKIGFAPDARAAMWEHQFAVAETFYREHGHLEPPQGYRSKDVSLGPWLSQQRRARGDGSLGPEREARLNAIGMVWQIKYTFDERLVQIQDYYAVHNRLPTQTSDPALGSALSKMRAAHKNGQLEQHLVDALDAMGIVWDTAAVIEESFERHLAAAARYHSRYGHLDVRPSDTLHSDDAQIDLAGWIKYRRADRSRGALADTEIAALDALDMIWDVPKALWEHSYSHCARFYAEHGHLRVPTRYTVPNARGEDYNLNTWINRQRSQRDKLSDDQILLLDKLGMDWDPFTSRWEASLTALQAFHDEHGHLNVPDSLTNDDGVNLHAVLNVCRTRRRRGTLPPERAAALDAMNIDWEPGNAAAWDRTMDALRAYYAEHGNILIPQDFTNSKGVLVTKWLTTQRKRRANGELTEAQIAELDAVGMVWDKGGSRWARTLTLLTAVRERYGTVNVTNQQSQNDPEARKAYTLGNQYRATRAKDGLPEEKIAALDELGFEWNPVHARDQQWQTTFEAVAAFRRAHGHLDIPAGTLADNDANLRSWLTYQRLQKDRGLLAADRVAALDALGMEWSSGRDQQWDRAISEAEHHIRTVGPLADVRAGHKTPTGFGLYEWLRRQCHLVEQCQIPAERVQQLDDLGALARRHRRPAVKPAKPTEPKPDPWPADLAALQRFYAEHGTINISRERDHAIGTIISRVRASRRAGRLPADQIAALDALSIDWEPRQSLLERGIAAARRFHAEHGHLLPPNNYTDSDGVRLYAWVVARRTAGNAGTLTQAEIDELDAIGMVWNLAQATWDEGLAAATVFHTRHGHLTVPVDYRGTDLRGEPYDLARFLHKQRSYHRKGTLAPERVDALEALGIDWNPSQTRWEANLKALRAYHREHGHIILPSNHMFQGVDIGDLLSRLRHKHASGALAPERVAELEAMGIIWKPQELAWSQMIEFLTQYKAEHGHIRVPGGVRTPPGLIDRRGVRSQHGIEVEDWLSRQRNRRMAGDLTDGQIADLDALGMVWEKNAQKQQTWRDSFAVAQRFHARHGHLNVPVQNPRNSDEINSLYRWTCAQRRLHQDGKLDPEKVVLLDSIGMDWNPMPAKQAAWLAILADVTAHREEHGHLTFSRNDPEQRRLGTWVDHQRAQHAKGELKPDRVALLNSIGMDWRSESERAWDEAIARLRTYCATVGDPNTMVSRYISPDGFGLYHWLGRARRLASEGSLTADAVNDLISCGVRIDRRGDRRRKLTAP